MTLGHATVGEWPAGSDAREPSTEPAPATWSAWTAAIGTRAAPQLQVLVDLVPTLTSAMLCTTDGLNLCALGAEEGQVARLAALTSSLYAVSGASVVSRPRSHGAALDHITLTAGNNLMVVTAIPHASLGRVLLWAAADDVTLGLLLLAVRQTAERVAAAIGSVAVPGPVD
jgi:predicted regulator of Ras-like GTPase activity (Roadblock/LC7/MglB family)